MKRSDVLLLLIEGRCHEGMHWVPRYGDEWIRRLNMFTTVSGPGDRSALNALLRRGLIQEILPTGGYEITEEGRLYAQTLI